MHVTWASQMLPCSVFFPASLPRLSYTIHFRTENMIYFFLPLGKFSHILVYYQPR